MQRQKRSPIARAFPLEAPKERKKPTLEVKGAQVYLAKHRVDAALMKELKRLQKTDLVQR